MYRRFRAHYFAARRWLERCVAVAPFALAAVVRRAVGVRLSRGVGAVAFATVVRRAVGVRLSRGAGAVAFACWAWPGMDNESAGYKS